MRTDQELAAYIGLDWGDQRHAVQIQAAAGGPVEQLELEQRPHVLHGWVAQLRERFGGRPVGIAIEQRRGAVIHALMQYEFLVLYPVNPKALARYREAFHPSGAKDDPTDAALLLGPAAQTSRPAPAPGTRIRSPRASSSCSASTAASSSICGAASRTGSPACSSSISPRPSTGSGPSTHGKPATFCASGRHWPPSSGPAPTTVRRFYQQHNCRRAAVIDARLAEMATAQPLTTDPAIVDTLSLVVQSYAAPTASPARGHRHLRGPNRGRLRRPPGSGSVHEFPRCRRRLHARLTGQRLQRFATQQPQHHVALPAGAPPLPRRQGARPGRRPGGTDSSRPPGSLRPRRSLCLYHVPRPNHFPPPPWTLDSPLIRVQENRGRFIPSSDRPRH